MSDGDGNIMLDVNTTAYDDDTAEPFAHAFVAVKVNIKLLDSKFYKF